MWVIRGSKLVVFDLEWRFPWYVYESGGLSDFLESVRKDRIFDIEAI